MHYLCTLALIVCMLLASAASASSCFGTTSNGRLEGGEQLPRSGANFSAYSLAGVVAGRTYVHRTVAKAVTDAYRALEQAAPGKVFVYGETGWEKGGRFKPHRTHQNGLSVDFMVPVLDRNGRSVPLPTNLLNKFGYDIEFDANAEWDGLRIDFEAIGEHLYQLHLAAANAKAGIALVILDVNYLPMLFATRRGIWLREHVKFMPKQAWVRHDDHYHVDFAVTCKPMR